MPVPLLLGDAPLGVPLVVTALDVEPGVGRRLSCLGVRRGVRVRLLRRLAAGGRIVEVAGARVAVEGAVLACLTAEPA